MSGDVLKTLYLAGPMSGIPQFNYPLFRSAARNLREQGFDVRNPAEIDDEEDQKAAMASTDGSFASISDRSTWGDFLSRDVKIVADEVNAVVLLPGWEDSRGARLEAFVAYQLQKPVMSYKKGGVLLHLPVELGMDMIYEGTVAQGDVSRYG